MSGNGGYSSSNSQGLSNKHDNWTGSNSARSSSGYSQHQGGSLGSQRTMSGYRGGSSGFQENSLGYQGSLSGFREALLDSTDSQLEAKEAQ